MAMNMAGPFGAGRAGAGGGPFDDDCAGAESFGFDVPITRSTFSVESASMIVREYGLCAMMRAISSRAGCCW